MLKSVFAHLFWDASPQEGKRLEAFQSFYAEFYDYVRRVLFWMVPENVLDDLCQEVFLKIWKSRNGFKSEASPKTWVYRIAVNAAHDYHRKHRRVFESFEDTDPLKNFLEKHDRRPPPPPTHHFAQLKERIDAEASSFLRWPQALIAGLALVALVLFLQSRHEAAIKTDQELATFLSETYRTDFNAEDSDYPDQQGAYYFELLN